MILSSLTPGDLPSLCPTSRPSTLSSPFRKKTSESILQRVQKTRERCRLSLLQFKSSPHDHSPPCLSPLPCLLQACTPLVISIAILTGSEQSRAPFNFYLKWVLPVCCSQPHIPLAPHPVSMDAILPVSPIFGGGCDSRHKNFPSWYLCQHAVMT